MDRVSVSSSNISSIGYDSDSYTLEIEFLNGKTYQYFDVPVHVHEGLMQAASHGSYFNANVRNTYRYTLL